MTPEEIAGWTRKDLVRARAERPRADLKAKARNAAALKECIAAIRRKDAFRIVVDFKRTDPEWKGPPSSCDAAEFAATCAKEGAAAISVRTSALFHGSVEDLRAIRTATDLPVIRQDLIVDDYQLFESRVMLADAVVLTARVLDRSQLADYAAMAREDLGLAVFAVVESEKGLTAALAARCPALILVNPAPVGKTVSLETTARLRHFIPPDVAVVSQGGIRSKADHGLLGHLGVDAVIIGEEQGAADDPAAAIREWKQP